MRKPESAKKVSILLAIFFLFSSIILLNLVSAKILFFYHPDHLGSTTLITNSSGSIVEETFYLPYGQVAGGGSQEIKLFTGKELDDTGFYYYGARYYNPYTTRFISPDLNLPDLYNPQALNRYSYTLNNPYKYVDVEGKWAKEIGPVINVGSGVGGGVGSGIVIIHNEITGETYVREFYKSEVGLVGGGGASVDIYSYDPNIQTIEDYEGTSLNLKVSGALPPVKTGVDIELYPGKSQTTTIGFGGEAEVGIFGQYKTTTPLGSKGGLIQKTTDPFGINKYINTVFDIFSQKADKGKNKQAEEKAKEGTKQPKQKDKTKEFYDAINKAGSLGSSLFIIGVFLKTKNKKKRKRKILFQATGGIVIGESALYSFRASWPFGKIEVYEDKIILRVQYFPDFLLKLIFTRSAPTLGAYKKIPREIILSYNDIIGYKRYGILPLTSGVRLIHKNKKYAPYLVMGFFGLTGERIINFLELHRKKWMIRAKTTLLRDAIANSPMIGYVILIAAIIYFLGHYGYSSKFIYVIFIVSMIPPLIWLIWKKIIKKTKYEKI